MQKKRFNLGLSLLLPMALSWMPPANGQDPSKNAALQYWSALVYLPEDSRMTQWELPNREPLTAPIEDIEFLLNDSGIGGVAQWALEDLRRGAIMPYCEWGMLRKGPYAPAHHVQRSSTAVGLLLLSARLEQSRGNWTGAIDDLNAAWAFSRHLASDGTPAGSIAYSYKVEHRLAPLTAAWLPQLDKATVRKLREVLEQLPEAPTLSESLQAEKAMWLPWIRDSVDRHGLDWLIEELRNNGDLEESLEAALKDEKELVSHLEETGELMDESARVASLPVVELSSAATRFKTKIDCANPLARLVLGSQDLVARKNRDSKHRVIMAMLSAAINLSLDGREGFQRVRDPFGVGPFDYNVSENGYTLTSQLIISDEPVSMKFGRGAIPEVNKVTKLWIYNPDSDPTDDIRVALETAQREDKRILLQWGFNGCIPCYRLHRVFEESKPLSDILRKHFIHLHVDVTNIASEALIKKYRVEMPGVPHLTILGEDGQVLANSKPSEQFYVFDTLDTNMLLGFLEKWASIAGGHKR